jgi:hypothetical protein
VLHKTRPLLLAAVLLLCLLRAGQTVVGAAASLGLPGLVGGDFIAYETAGSIVDEGDIRQLYDLGLQRRVGQAIEAAGGVPSGQYFRIAFDNPPPIALLFALLALLPARAGLALWTLFNIGCTFFAVWYLLRQAPLGNRLTRLTIALGLLVFWPDFLGFFYGQMMGLVLLLYALTASWMRSRHDVAAGAGLALLAAIKPQYAVVLLLIVLLQRRRRTLAAVLAAGGALALLSLAVVGVGGLRAYLGELGALDPYAGNGAYLIDPATMINWRALLLQFLPALPTNAGFLLCNTLAALTVLAALVLWWRTERQDGDPFGWPFLVATCATLLATYHSNVHGAMLLLVPFCMLAPTATPVFRSLMLAIFWPPVIALGLLGPGVFALRPAISLYVAIWLLATMAVAKRAQMPKVVLMAGRRVHSLGH